MDVLVSEFDINAFVCASCSLRRQWESRSKPRLEAEADGAEDVQLDAEELLNSRTYGAQYCEYRLDL